MISVKPLCTFFRRGADRTSCSPVPRRRLPAGSQNRAAPPAPEHPFCDRPIPSSPTAPSPGFLRRSRLSPLQEGKAGDHQFPLGGAGANWAEVRPHSGGYGDPSGRGARKNGRPF